MYERQVDPIERPVAICPNCHRNTVMLFAVDPKDSDVIECNSYGCGWSGLFKEARDAVVGTVEAISNGRGFRIWVRPSELA